MISKIKSDMMALLSRREYSAVELKQRLLRKYDDADAIDVALEECQRLKLQSDQRFAESRIRLRSSQGQGPVRIRQELRHLGVDDLVIEQAFEDEPMNWVELAKMVLQKKYGKFQHSDIQLVKKQQHFLSCRGFPMEIIAQVRHVFKTSDDLMI